MSTDTAYTRTMAMSNVLTRQISRVLVPAVCGPGTGNTFSVPEAMRAASIKKSKYVAKIFILAAACLQKLYKEQKDIEHGVKIHIKDIISGECSTKQRELIRKALRRLVSTPIEIKNDENKYIVVPLLTHAAEVKKTGYIHVNFSSFIRKHLINQTHDFTVIDVNDFLNLNTAKAQYLYLLAASWAGAGKFSMLEEDLCYHFVSKFKVPDFLKFILQPAVEEVNTNTKMQIDFTPWRRSRKYIGVHFTVVYNVRNRQKAASVLSAREASKASKASQASSSEAPIASANHQPSTRGRRGSTAATYPAQGLPAAYHTPANLSSLPPIQANDGTLAKTRAHCAQIIARLKAGRPIQV